MNRQSVKKILKISIFAIIIILIVLYTLFAFHNLIEGPEIIITQPQNGSTLTSPTVTIEGISKHNQDLTLNGKSILIDEKGHFNEITSLAPGYNVITLMARDKFGRNKEYRLQLIYKVN